MTRTEERAQVRRLRKEAKESGVRQFKALHVAHAHAYAQHPHWQTHLYCTVCGFAIVKNPRLSVKA